MEAKMNGYNRLSEKAVNYIKSAKRIGAEEGDSRELSSLCRQAYSDYRSGVISVEEYERIYAACMDYAYPR